MKANITLVNFCLLTIAFLFVASIETQAAMIRVPADYPNIQQAINAAQNGDTVLVAPGTYFENINFLGKAITLTSLSGAQLTIIDGNLDDAVAKFVSGENLSSILNGFTLRNGKPANVFQNGGGIIIEDSSPTITNNIITNNSSSFSGGGIGIVGVGTPVISNNIISNNQSGTGGGIATRGSSPLMVIKENMIVGNQAFSFGGGLYIGGVSSVQILNNIISGNIASEGGGIELFSSGRTIIQNNTIKENLATSGAGMATINESPALIIQNLFIDNQAAHNGGGITFQWPPEALINNTFANNAANNGSGVFVSTNGTTTFSNNIIFGKAGISAIYYGGSFTPGFSQPFLKANNIFTPNGMAYGGLISDQTGMNGNISTNPLFVNPSAGDYHLQSGSPSIDSGDNSAPNLPTTDFDGNPRIFDGDHNGSAIVDMGVYEFGSSAFDLCIQDDSSKDVLRINTTTGAYQLTRCSNGFTLTGTAILTRKGCTLNIQDFSSDRRIMAKIDTCQNKATASIQVFAQGLLFSLTDRNTTNNSCNCPIIN